MLNLHMFNHMNRWTIVLLIGCVSIANLRAEVSSTTPAVQNLPMGPTVKDYQPQRKVVLPPLSTPDLKLIQHEDTADGSKVYRAGIVRSFDKAIIIKKDSVPASEWKGLPNGWKIFSVAITSQGAKGIRVPVDSIAIPNGARLVFYTPTAPTYADRIVTLEQLHGESKVWGGPIQGERVIVECDVPPQIETASVAFAISGISHLYR